jgi:hypothetical protein
MLPILVGKNLNLAEINIWVDAKLAFTGGQRYTLLVGGIGCPGYVVFKGDEAYSLQMIHICVGTLNFLITEMAKRLRRNGMLICKISRIMRIFISAR